MYLRLRIPFGIAIPACLLLSGLNACSAAGEGQASDSEEATTQGAQALSGSLPFAVLRCKYPDDPADPINNQNYASLLDQVRQIWAQTSYGHVSILGSQVFPTCGGTGCSAYFTLPAPKSAYVNGDEGDFEKFANDCMAVADAQVNFSQYYGVILFPNGGLPSNGGSKDRALNPPRDGVSVMPTAWLPTAQVPHIAHELGHTFGLPHLRPNVRAPVVDGARYDILASGSKNTNMFHKDQLGWVGNKKRVVTAGSSATVTLDNSAQPPSGSPNHWMAQVPIQGSAASVVLEARRRFGIDQGLEHEGVVIYYADPTDDEWVSIVDPDGDTEVNEASSFFTQGESHTDVALGLSVNVLSKTTAGYRVSVSYNPPACEGDGFRATYFDNADLTAPKVTRVDPTITFRWKEGSPDPSIGSDTFSARWEGEIKARVSGLHTFYANTDDGVRLWVNGQLLIDAWQDRCCEELSGSIQLQAGQRYSLKMEYYEQGGGAEARLTWSAPGMPELPISRCDAFSSSSSSCAGVPEWNAADHWTTYSVGSRRTRNNRLYECHTPGWCYQDPAGSWGYLGWTDKGGC